MRILPYELYPYAPNLSLCALRKEFGMYDYCLNINKNNQAMQPFLDMGRNYFNLSLDHWIKEMQQRKNYINSFHLFYAKKNKYKIMPTPLFLILECCIQWEIKSFVPYQNNISWFEIFIKFFKSKPDLLSNFNLKTYNCLLQWYQKKFIKLNKKGIFKPYQLHMKEVIHHFCEIFNNNL